MSLLDTKLFTLENTGGNAVAIGYRAGYKNRISATNYNVFLGTNSGRENASGNRNTYLGYGAVMVLMVHIQTIMLQ